MDLLELDLLEEKVQKAEERWRSGQWRPALELYCEIFLEQWRKLDGRSEALTAADLTILERIADLSAPIGFAQLAESVLAQVAQGYRRLGSQYWADLITLKRIHVAFANHDPFRARELFRELGGTLAGIEDAALTETAFSQWENGYPASPGQDLRLLCTNFYLQLARLLMLLGRYRFARATSNRGRELAQQMGASGKAIEIHLRLAATRASLECGELPEAQSTLAQLSPLLDQQKNPGHYTTWLELSAQIDLLRGNFGNAEQGLAQVLTVCMRQGFTVPALYTMLSHAELLVLLNRTVDAKRLLAAISAEAKSHRNSAISSEVDRLMLVAAARVGFNTAGPESVLEMQIGAQPEATPQKDAFEFRVSTEGRSLDSFQSRALQFQYYLGARHRSAAEKCLLRLRAFSSSESSLIQTRLAVLEGMYRYYTDDTAGAFRSIAEALPYFHARALKPELWHTQELYLKCLEKLNPEAERESIARQNHALLEELAGSLPLSDRALFLLNKPTDEEQELGRRIRDLQDLTAKKPTGTIARLSRFFAVQHALNQILDFAFRQKAALAVSHLAATRDEPQAWPSIALWKRLYLRSSRTATLVFLVLPDSVLVLALTWGRIQFRIVQTSRLRIREIVRTWHETIGASRPDESNRLASLLVHELQLDEMIAELPSRANRLVIVPDDVLHGFPFSAIRIRNQYLPERFAISIAFQPEPRRPSWRPSKVGESPFLFGVTEGNPPLPKTAVQLKFVQDWLRQQGIEAPLRLNEEVSPDTLADLLQRATMAHISCHGEFVPGQPEQTGLQLCFGDGRTQTFSLTRLFRLNLQRLRHVTLLSCWGADNYVLPGRWILSLPEVLWRAGADRIIVSLWEVSEDRALDFVRHFYGELPGRRTDEAFQRTLLHMMRGENGSALEPIDWAGFQLYGDAHRFRL
jgi:CHAT domain-containing protein